MSIIRKNKNTLALFFLVFFLFNIFFETKKAEAQWVTSDLGALVQRVTQWITTQAQLVTETISTNIGTMDYLDKITNKYTLPIMKVAAIALVHETVQLAIGTGNNGGAQFVKDWNDYLYLTPQDRAMTYMNTFFNGVSGGRLNNVGYEGLSTFDNYLASAGKDLISGQTFVTTMPNYTSNPRQLFSTGSMQPLLALTRCANNPYCYSMVAQSTYQERLEREQKVAQSKVSNGGFISKTNKNGIVQVPGVLFEGMMQGVDQMGNQMISNATMWEEVAAGATTRIVSQLLQYQFGSDSAKERVAQSTQRGTDVTFDLKYTAKCELNEKGKKKDPNCVEGVSGNTRVQEAPR